MLYTGHYTVNNLQNNAQVTVFINSTKIIEILRIKYSFLCQCL